jgi:hypothetical protein
MDLILVVGKNPLSDLHGFDGAYRADLTTYGTVIPDKIAGGLISELTFDSGTGASILTLVSGTNDLGDNAGITLESGETIDLAGVDGVYTAGTPDTGFTDVIVAKLNGVQNMAIDAMATYASAATSDANTIVVTLDSDVAVSTDVSEWAVDIDAGTPNVVTDAVLSGDTVTLTVTDAITVGQVVTVTHTRSTTILAFADQAVTNNEV